MTSIKEIIQQGVNPFDPVTFHTGNFWREQQDSSLTVKSIHKKESDRIKEILNQVARDHQTRSLLLLGDRGCGKSYLLGRLKRELNIKAFFAYIGPWADSSYIWRHILRYTIDSLMHVPEDKQESQLLLWLRSVLASRGSNLMKKVLGERKLFINDLKATYPTGIYKAGEFFSILYSLTNPELYSIACDWLRGEILEPDDLKALGVRSTIDTEDAAQNILGNFGRISADTYPIVLCFDQIDKVALPPHGGHTELQHLFSVNTTLHNERLKNFLVIISLIKDTWNRNKEYINGADKDRFIQGISLKPISLDQAEAIWEKRLTPLHDRAFPKPETSIFPLARQKLEEKFPGDKTMPRYVLQLGQKLIREYKIGEDRTLDIVAAFKLIWHKEFVKNQQKVSRIRQFSSPELIQMLQEALSALEIKGIQTRLLPSPTYASYSFSYESTDKSQQIGVAWSEEPGLRSFCNLMKACEKAIKQNLCDSLILIRAEKLGQSNNKGYKIFKRIFADSSHRHITPHTDSIHYLASYQNLVNAACSGELVVGDKTPNLEELESLTRDSNVLYSCPLLKELLDTSPPPPPPPPPIKDFLLNLVKTQQLMGRQTLIQNVQSQFSQVNESDIDNMIEQLCQENQIQILDPNAPKKSQLVCLVPQSS